MSETTENILHFTAGDGCKIAYKFDADNQKGVLILSPSLGTAMPLFDPQMDALSQRFSVLRYDPRGHGASDVPSGTYSLDRLGRDVIELMDHLNLEKAHFCGVSLGGMTGQWLGYRASERMNRLVLANTSAYMGPPSGWDDRIVAVLANGMGPMVDPVMERWFTPEFLDSNQAEVAPIQQLLEATAVTGYAGCSGAIRDMDMRPILPQIVAKTLIISGSRDSATPIEHGELLAGNIPDAELAILDAAHLSNIECSRLFNGKVMVFLSQS